MKHIKRSVVSIPPGHLKMLTLPKGAAIVEERSFSQVKMVKTRLCSRLKHVNLSRLMRIAIEGLEMSTTDFCGIIDIFKDSNLMFIANLSIYQALKCIC